MFRHQCVRCGRHWMSQAHPGGVYAVITKWCPDCIPQVFPTHHSYSIIEMIAMGKIQGSR